MSGDTPKWARSSTSTRVKKERVTVEVGQIREDPDPRFKDPITGGQRRVEVLADNSTSWYAGDHRPAAKVKRLDTGKITRINIGTLEKWKVVDGS